MFAEYESMTTELATAYTTEQVAAIADAYASAGAFSDYQDRKAGNTLRAQAAALDLFADFLTTCKVRVTGHALMNDPASWKDITWGLVTAFRNWQLSQGYAIASINQRLGAVRVYAGIAHQAGILDTQALILIRGVQGYSRKEAGKVDEKRADAGTKTRCGAKKAQTTLFDADQAAALKTQPDTCQGRRDALLLALLIDHGLRVSEVAILEMSCFNLKKGVMTFERPKVNNTGTHKLTADTLLALRAWVDSGDAPPFGPILRASRKGGALTTCGMTTSGIAARVRELGAAVGIEALSPHDLRHFCASEMAGRDYSIKELMDWFGWNSPAMAVRYIKGAEIQERYKG